MKILKKILIICIYFLGFLGGLVYMYPEIGEKIDEKSQTQISAAFLANTDLAILKLRLYKIKVERYIDSVAPNTSENIDDKINTLENAK